MTQDRDASSNDKPTETPPDAGKAYDKSMTVEDEANVPKGSDADPKASPKATEPPPSSE